MAKSNGIKKDKNIKELKKIHLTQNLIIIAIIDIVGLFIGLNYAGYCARIAEHRQSIGDFASKLMSNPAMFWNDGFVSGMGDTLAIVFAVLLVVDMLLYAEYIVSSMRLHNNADESMGRTTWADMKEITNKYADHVDEEKHRDYVHAYNNAICSQHTYVSMNTRKHFHALNMLILGATGSGKSRYYLKPNILQMNTSYVVTDPKGEILDACGEMLWRNGYNVRVFDITPEGMQSGQTSRYNPLKYCKEESDIRKIMEAFMKNVNPDASKKGGSADPFWDEATRMFLSTCVAFLVQKPTNGDERPYGQIPEITGGLSFNPCFAALCELTRMAGNKWKPGGRIKLMDGVNLEPDKNAPQKASEIGAIMENIRAYEAKIQNTTPDLINKPYVLMEWENFWGTPEKTATTVMTTTAVKLDAFNIEQVKNLTSIDTIDLESFGKGRDALFLIIPPTDKTYNFLVSFLYTQLFDILYSLGSKGVPGSKNLKLENGELVKFFPAEEVDAGSYVDDKVKAIRNAKAVHNEGKGKKTGEYTYKKGNKKITEKVTIDDGWYEIYDADGDLITRRSTKQAADEYIAALKTARLEKGRQPAIPCHVRFLMDEFPNIGEVPEFKEKLATMRGYEISATVICQSITQLKGMYPDDFQVIDGNCPFVIFLGGDENENNEYLAKKIGSSTIKTESNSINDKKVGANVDYKEGHLLRAEDFGRIDYSQEVVFIYGEMPIMDEKFDYPNHKNYKLSRDYAADCGTDAIMLDRSQFKTECNINIITKIETPTAMVDVKAFTADALLSILGIQEEAEVDEKVKRNIKKHSFESESQAGEF